MHLLIKSVDCGILKFGDHRQISNITHTKELTMKNSLQNFAQSESYLHQELSPRENQDHWLEEKKNEYK
jgi:hypothetical protein